MTADPVGAEPRPAPTPVRRTLAQSIRCGSRVLVLLWRGALHVRHDRVGRWVTLPDGRRFEVFRETCSDAGSDRERVVLAVWFHLKGMPAGARLRRAAFERECILNTILFAGFEGYRIKLWMVDPASSDYAGLYEWSDPEQAEIYARYITAVLGPLSRSGSVGYQILADETLATHLGEEPGHGGLDHP